MSRTPNTASARLAEVEQKLAEARAARDDLEAQLAEQATDKALVALEKAEAEVARLERLHAALQRAAAKEMNIGELRERLESARGAFAELREAFATRREIRRRADQLLAELSDLADRDEQTTQSIWNAVERIAEAIGAKSLLRTIDIPLAGNASAWALFYRLRDSRVARVLMPAGRVEIHDTAYLGGRETPLEEALDRDEQTAGDRIVAAIDAFAQRVARAEADAGESQEPEKPRSWHDELEAKRHQFRLAASGGLGAGGAA